MASRSSEVLVLAIDMGTSSTRSALFDQNGRHFARTTAQQKYSVAYDREGGAELSPRTLLAAARRCVRETQRLQGETAALRSIPISAVAGSGFWHSLLGLDENGKAITPIYTWADSRSERAARRLRSKFSEHAILARTGCMLRFCYWPAKLLWLRETEPRLFARVRRWVSPADWVFEKLFGLTSSSESMASASGLFDQHRRTWDRALCRACGVAIEQLPTVSQPPSERDGTLILPPLGDGAASHLALGARVAKTIGISVGTSGAVRLALPRKDTARHPIPFGLFRYVMNEKFDVLGGAISNGGNLRNWCLRELRLSDQKQTLSRAKAAADSLTLLPSWVQERSPSWPDRSGGAIVGMTPSTTAQDLFRAATTATFNRLAQILDLLEGHAGRARRIVLSAGITRSDDSMRLLADVLGRDIEVSPELEMSLRGAALHALAGLGLRPKPLRHGRIVRCQRKFARQHRERRSQQIALEKLLA